MLIFTGICLFKIYLITSILHFITAIYNFISSELIINIRYIEMIAMENTIGQVLHTAYLCWCSFYPNTMWNDCYTHWTHWLIKKNCDYRSALHWFCGCRSWFVKSWGCENSNANLRGTSVFRGPTVTFCVKELMFEVQTPEVFSSITVVYNSLRVSNVLQHRKFDSDWKSSNEQ